jgi:hypothetical protein
MPFYDRYIMQKKLVKWRAFFGEMRRPFQSARLGQRSFPTSMRFEE